MKNFGLLILGIILGALAMYFYYSKADVPMTMDYEGEKLTGLITPEQAEALDKAYNIKYNVINDSLFRDSKTGDNRSSWWSLDQINKFIAFAQTEANDNKQVMDGLRLYLGAYPDINGQAGLTTLFFIPTGYPEGSSEDDSPEGDGSGDLKGSHGFNFGHNGHPPGSNYPQ